MNELITPSLSQLPSLPVEDVKQTVDKVGAYVDALAAAKRAATDQNTINEIDDQIRKYSAFKLRCQMELGERTAKMEKNTDFHGNQYSGDFSHGKDTKTEKVSNLGLTPKQAWQNEQLVKLENRNIVEHYIEAAEEAEEIPTISGALKEIKEAKKPHVTNNSKDDEWYTPEQYIEAARLVMGSIDLDPASNEFANEVVRAGTYFDEETDGLMQEWFGNIWLNPPYSTALVKDFTEKLTNSEFEQAIVLVNNATETAWFRKMIDNASAVVFTTGRIKFRKRDGEHGTPLQGQAFIYFGDNFYAFLDEFRRFGWGCLL